MIREKAREPLQSGLLDEESCQDAVWELGAEFISRNFSPGWPRFRQRENRAARVLRRRSS